MSGRPSARRPEPGNEPVSVSGPAPVPRSAPVPVHRRPGLLVAVCLGGALGAPLRYALGRAVPPAASGFPTGTLLVNLLGCLLLGALVAGLASAAPTSLPGRYGRAFLGSGLLGAFTTYSTFAVEVDRLVLDGHVAVALAYVAASLGGGLLAAAAGAWSLRWLRP